jgi:DNA-binding NarL/FixJ family response regulator
LRRSTDLSPG